MKRPLIIVSGLKANEALFVRAHLARWQRPCFLEATSRLRGDAGLEKFEIRGGEKSLKRLDFDGVIRIGGVPTLRFWRDLENSQLPLVNFSNIPLSGMPRETEVKPLMALADQGVQSDMGVFEQWSEPERLRDRNLSDERKRLMGQFPQSEISWVNWLSTQVARDARLFLGNSLPIREWDFAAEFDSATDIFANRGTNGIDGLVSTFAGLADPERSNWAVIGDLSALYDQAGLWALRQRPVNDFNLVVINNGGGQIFHRIFYDQKFLNNHDIGFQQWAKMWGLKYQRLQNDGHLPVIGEPRVIEIVPDNAQTDGFWNEWEKL